LEEKGGERRRRRRRRRRRSQEYDDEGGGGGKDEKKKKKITVSLNLSRVPKFTDASPTSPLLHFSTSTLSTHTFPWV